MIDAIGSGSIIIDPSFIERRLRTHSKTSVSAHSLSTYRRGTYHIILRFAIHTMCGKAGVCCYLCHYFYVILGISGLKAAAEFMRSFESAEEELIGDRDRDRDGDGNRGGGGGQGRAASGTSDPAYVQRQVRYDDGGSGGV